MERKRFTIVIAVLLAIGGVESEGALSKSDSRIMFFQPWHSENDIVRGRCNIETDRFVVAGGVE